MKRPEIERLRESVSCAVGLEYAGFAIDLKESTHRAVKYRRGGDVIIVTHEGRGWFHPLSDRKGDIFALIGWLQRGGFPATLVAVAALAGLQPTQPQWRRLPREKAFDIAERWAARMPLRPGSPAFNYLATIRSIPPIVLRRAAAAGAIRQGPFGSAWFAHQGEFGEIAGWEERGPAWRGFSSGGTKILFRFGNRSGGRLCVTEAAIDALSLAAIEGSRTDTLYASTAGGWSSATDLCVRELVSRIDLLVAATDRDNQGEAFADRLRRIAAETECGFQRLLPRGSDWNEDLKEGVKG